jgi:uridine kinase
VLLRWLKTRIRQVLVWYWLSPVLIYINYFHGQLDAIPIALLFISLYLLFKGRMLLAYALLAASVACKTNMVVVMPFYFLYHFRQNKESLGQPLAGLVLFAALVLLLNLPYITSDGFITMVYNNPVQTQVFDLFYQFNQNLRIYFIPAVFFVLVLWYYTLRFVNRDQLTLFLAFGFLALTLMVAPMQGWYYWIVPLLIYFVIRQGHRERQVMMALSLLYFIYFGLIPTSDYFNSANFDVLNQMTASLAELNSGEKALNIAFTLLQTTLLLSGVLVYRKGISSNIQAKFLSQPYLVGIGGDSAAGKSTLTRDLEAIFHPFNTTIIRGDDMHRWERGDENWKTHTHLDPKANRLHLDLAHTRQLKTGQNILRRNYDHSTGRFTLPRFIRPNKLIIFEGLHSFYLKDQSEIYDLKIYMEPEENLRVWWKVKRDVAKRSYSPGQVLEQLQQREEDSEKFIRSQRSRADIVVSFYSRTPLDVNHTEKAPDIGLKLTLPENIHIDLLMELLGQIDGLNISHRYTENRQEMDISGDISGQDISMIAWELLPELEEIGVNDPQWREGFNGLLQLITVYVIFNKIYLGL